LEVAVAVSVAVRGRSDTMKSAPKVDGPVPMKSLIAFVRLTLVYAPMSGLSCVESAFSSVSMIGVMTSPPSPVSEPSEVTACAGLPPSIRPIVRASTPASSASDTCWTSEPLFKRMVLIERLHDVAP
jgi:hypothetical protein